MLKILGAHLDVRRIVLQIIVAVGQGDATLVEARNLHGGVVHVGHCVERQQRTHPILLQVSNLLHELRASRHLGDAIKFGFQRLCTFRLDGFRIHAGSEVVTYFLLDGAMLARLCGVGQ